MTVHSAAASPSHSSTFTDATRVLTSFLAPLEKHCLIWMARRMPDRINSDHLTTLATLAMICAGVSYWLAKTTPAALFAVVICLAINWFGDSLDGTLARVRRQPRPRYGFYIDHVVDCIGAVCLLCGLGISGYMHLTVALGLLVVYLLFSAEVYLATYCLRQFKLSYFSLGPTELRIILAVGTLVLLVHPTATIAGHRYLLFDVGGVIAIVGLSATFVLSVVSNTRALAKADPRPPRPPASEQL